MAPLAAFTTFLLAGLTTARLCSNLTIPVSISARQGKYRNVAAETNLQTGAFAHAYTTQGRNYSDVLLEGFQTVTGKYSISAQFCSPGHPSNTTTVQLLSHGIGFDKT